MAHTRIEALRDSQMARQLYATALVPGANLFYFTGLQKSLSERPCIMFLPTDGLPHLLLPDFEAADAEQQLTFDHKMYVYNDAQGHEHAFQQVCEDLKLMGKRVGIEFTRMRVFEHQMLAASAPGCYVVNAEPLFADQRMCKDTTEFSFLQEAARINEDIFEQVIKTIKPGQTEKEIAATYQLVALRSGSDGLAFDPIVVAGPNGALPHAYPSARPVQAGEFVTLDCGVKCKSYCSDITRTFAIGAVSKELEAVYDIVREANEAGRANVRPGMTAEAIDRAARQVIVEAGYGQYFTHRAGHGLGLEVHEPPYIVEGNPMTLKPGMVFTIEPGVYIPGLGGVRIEDNVFVTPSGCQSLTTLSRELITL